MFHIKTDIRQFKCESEEKVERLIRNWVIRPSDLIYDSREDTWESIGEHSCFQEIFAVIEKEEANEPDTVVTEAPSEIAAEYEVAPGAEHEDETLNLDEDETLTLAEPAAPVPPEAPEGVEGLIRDSDEITMMTDKTLDMLREEAAEDPKPAEQADEPNADSPAEIEPNISEDAADESDESKDEDDAEEQPALGRHGLPEEVFVTDEILRKDVHAAVLDELGALDDDEPDHADDVDEDEVTQLVERDQFFDDESPAEVDPTDEIKAPADADDEPSDASETSEDNDDATDEEGDGKARWRIVMSEDDLDDSDDGQEHEDDSNEDADEENAGKKSAARDDSKPDHSTLDDDELDEMLNEAAALVGLSGHSPDEDADEDLDDSIEDISADALDPVDDDEFDDEQARDRAQTPVHPVTDPGAFVSDGYKIALPIDISPSAEDLRLGLKHSRLGRDAKNAVFPYPKPKTPGKLIWREFDLDPPEPRDHSLLLVAGFALLFVIVLLAAITVFG